MQDDSGAGLDRAAQGNIGKHGDVGGAKGLNLMAAVSSSRRCVLAAYALWMSLLIVIYYVVPSIRCETWGVLGLSGVTAIVAGVAINSPTRKAPWLLLAAANLSFVVGQVSFLVITVQLRTKLPFPSFTDVLYLLTYPLYAAGVLSFIRWRAPHGDRRSLLDALTLTVGMALLSWLYLIQPYVHNPNLSWVQKSFAIAYPLGDVLVLAMLARLLAPGSTRTRSVQLLAIGSIGMLVSDVSYALIELHGTFHSGTVVDLGWAFFYVAWGAAALHPTMGELTRPDPRQRPEVSPVRLAVLLLASLIAPVVLFIRAQEGRVHDASIIAVFSAILYLLVLSRLWDTAVSHRRTLGRERTVRLAGASLASAVTVDEAATAVSNSAASLLSPDTAPEAFAEALRDVFIAVLDDGVLRPAGTPYGDPALTDQLGELAQSWLPMLTDSVPRLMPAAELCDSTQTLTLAKDRDGILLCPLTLKDRPSGEPLIGVLVVFGEQRILADLLATFEILAQQAALAVERVMLSREVIRQGGEAYFRTLVQDTSDVILIIDDDGRVRYATPLAKSIFGNDTVEGQALWDLVRGRARGDPARAGPDAKPGGPQLVPGLADHPARRHHGAGPGELQRPARRPDRRRTRAHHAGRDRAAPA